VTRVDLHAHSTASDGEVDPARVVAHAGSVGVGTLALTDHDTLAGIPDAAQAGHTHDVRVIAGCEFSVGVWWGEMHLLGYFLPLGDPELDGFLDEQRQRRSARAATIVDRLNNAGVVLSLEDVMRESVGAAVGRPHVARALVVAGAVPDVSTAFDRYIGRGCPAFVAKDLPELTMVTSLVARMGGLTSAAHLGRRASRTTLARLKDLGVDGVEARHPSHDETVTARIERLGGELGMVLTGGSDWHGDLSGHHDARGLGGIEVPGAWVEILDAYVNTRTRERSA
jgi:3',5'-nucleoside bisphosphate phosphatase